MKRIMVSNDILPVSEFRSNTSGFIAQVHNTRRPLIITQNGKSAAVLLDVNEYDKLVDKIELLQETLISRESGKNLALLGGSEDQLKPVKRRRPGK